MSREVLTRQIVAYGRIVDAITDSKPRSEPRVSVVKHSDGKPLETLTVRVRPDASFALSGDPRVMLPPAATDIRIEVEAGNYSPASAVVSFTAAQLSRSNRALNVSGQVNDTAIIDGLPREQNFALNPLPVFIKGRVSQADDPAMPISGASVSITAPGPVGPVTSDADGFFSIGPLPVSANVTLSATAAGRQPLSRVITLDFSTPTNRASLPLEPI